MRTILHIIKSRRVVILSVLLFVTFWLLGYFLLDPDFGWHIRIGKIIAQEGIPYIDPLSYTMPSYPFVSHEWLLDLLTFHLYPSIGLLGLSFVYSLVALGSLVLQIVHKSNKWSILPLFMSGIVFMSFEGIRPQVISWLFFSFVWWSLFNKHFSVYKYFLPILFALWANMHGGFALGIVIVGIYFFCVFWKEKRIIISDIIVLCLSLLSTGITPYGYRMWWEIWTSLSDPSLRWSIQEWMPAFFVFQPAMWIFVVLSGSLFIRFWKRFTVMEKVIPVVLFLMGLSSIRHMPFWIICMLPITTKTLQWLYKDAAQYPFGASRFTKAYIGLSIISFIFVLPVLYGAYSSFHQDTTAYPAKAVVYIHEHPLAGNIFVPYEWGGYFDWRLPEKKVFIDGRMPSWRWKAPKNEENSAFQTYKDVIAEKIAFKKIQGKYNINTVVLYHSEVKRQSSLSKKLDQLISHIFLHQKSTFELDLTKQLKEAGMKKVYEDDVTVIYRVKS